MSKKAVTIVSGGLDSVTLAHFIHSMGFDQDILTFNYGQRHSKEIDCAASCARDLKAEHQVIDLRALGGLFKGSALTNPSIPVPTGHYADDNMAVTIVPNRNAIMLSIAWGVAISKRATAVGYAAHSGDHAIYPDCRPTFVEDINAAFQTGSDRKDIFVIAPFISLTKADIVKRAVDLHVPFKNTWSCYVGGSKACGKCGTCVERLEAFSLAGVTDPLEYVDTEFWKKEVAKAASK